MRFSRMILAALLPAAIIAIIVLPAQVAGKEVGKGAGHEWFQTVPTRTPTPAPPTVTPTALPPTVTPTAQPPTATAPPPTVTPTDAPATVTPRPGPTDTPEPGATDTPTAPPATVTGAPETGTPTPTPAGTPTPTRPPATAGLSVAITGAVMVMPGRAFTVSVVAVNIGNVLLEQGEVQVMMPPAFTLTTAQASTGSFDAGRRLWRLTNLAPNQPQQLTLVLSVGSGVPLGSVLDIEAQAAGRTALLTVGLPPSFLPPVGGNPDLAAQGGHGRRRAPGR